MRIGWIGAIVAVVVVACGLTHDVDGLSENYGGAAGALATNAVTSGGGETAGAQSSSAETAVSSSTTGACVEPVVPCGEVNTPCCQCSPACPHDYSHCNASGMCEQCGWAGGDPCCSDETLDENMICEGIKRCVNGQCLKCCAKCTGDATIFGPLDTGGDNNCAPTSGVVQTKCKAEKDCGMSGAAPCCPSMCVANSGWCAECTAALCSL